MRALVVINGIPGDAEGTKAIDQTWFKALPEWCQWMFCWPSTYDLHFQGIQSCLIGVTDYYDYFFICDRDTYVRPERFLDSRFDHHDYVGYPLTHHDWPHPYASGGAGYWLSKRAAKLVAEARQPHFHADISVGMILHAFEIPLWHDPRYFIWREKWNGGIISMHLSKGQGNYDPAWMREVHEEFLCWKQQ